MTAQRAFIGLGANLDDPARQVECALDAIARLPQTVLVTRSALYLSRPMGPADQPDYINAVALVETRLPAATLLEALLSIERQQGRLRSAGQRNAPRTLDLDLLLYGELVCDDQALTLPHPGAHQRDFVLVPLAQIAPHTVIPGRGRVTELLTTCARHGLREFTDGPLAALAG
ncbi:MAG: 2-amino-4-hydroxy-6-hydroxymethyldihydropteridine diphosphokinase [Immundisolibacter sp.]|uniref:2-amino-4-hydroxy-6- hydroxymethyldihydropteridine diphosphokinase n=1 Tax=Immundisolibacter sp. TaxID=1934948 RepID=UPI003EDFEC4D